MLKNDPVYVKCPLCGADNYFIRYPATIPHSSKKSMGHFCCTSKFLCQHGDIAQCKKCGILYSNPQPDPGELLEIYKTVEDPGYLEERRAREHTFKHSLDQLHEFVQPPGKLLDVGCYIGTFMDIAHLAGWEVWGQELSVWASKIAQRSHGGKVYNDLLSLVPGPRNSLDVVTMWDVIEHLSNPGNILDEAANQLKPGGILAMSTHMVDSWMVRLLGKRYPFFMDMHLVHFSRTTIKRILNNHGFEVLAIKSHKRILRIGYFMKKLAEIMPFGRSMVRNLERKAWFSKRFIRIGLLGLVNIFARKSSSSLKPF